MLTQFSLGCIIIWQQEGSLFFLVRHLLVPIACYHHNSLNLNHDLFQQAHKNLNHQQDPGENKAPHFEVLVRPIFCSVIRQ